MKFVVVIGVDGVRLDTLRAARTPEIDAIEATGFLADFQLSEDAPTMSGPTWATVLTGVWPRWHGVYSNNFTGNRLVSFPDVLTRVRRKGVKTYIATSWSPLVTSEWGGPMLGCPTKLTFINCDDVDYWELDESLTADAVDTLSTRDYQASFVYLGNPDHVAHDEGCGASYVRAVEEADRQIGRILRAIDARPRRAAEEWTVIVVTDHGHRDEGGHGGRTEWERTAWAAAMGPRVAPPDLSTVSHVDITPTVLAALGLPVHSEDGFPGQSWMRA